MQKTRNHKLQSIAVAISDILDMNPCRTRLSLARAAKLACLPERSIIQLVRLHSGSIEALASVQGLRYSRRTRQLVWKHICPDCGVVTHAVYRCWKRVGKHGEELLWVCRDCREEGRQS